MDLKIWKPLFSINAPLGRYELPVRGDLPCQFYRAVLTLPEPTLVDPDKSGK